MSIIEPPRIAWQPAADSLVGGARFLTRLPLPWPGQPSPDISAIAWTFPVIGAVIGLAGGIAYAAGIGLNLGPLASATLAVTAAVLLTGALHEDGLADTLDGFGGGASITQKLDIMRDSRLGTYGALGIVLSLLLRVAAIDALAPLGPVAVLLVLVAAEAAARAAMVRLWQELPAARTDGLSSSAGQPQDGVGHLAIGIAVAIGLVTLLPAAGVWSAFGAALGAVAAVVVFTRVARAQIGGQTGDVLGAMEQIALIAFLLLAAAFM
jgi:adenosylcobinamide-GDP ribazoletransferase